MQECRSINRKQYITQMGQKGEKRMALIALSISFYAGVVLAHVIDSDYHLHEFINPLHSIYHLISVYLI